MKGLSLKYILKCGIKKTVSDPVRNICSVLLCAACAILFVYSGLFFLYEPSAVQAKFIMDLNESDYKYTRIMVKGQVYPANSDVADYIAEKYKSIKYVNIPSGASFIEMNYAYNDFYDLYITNSYEDILSFGYTFYGDYEKTLSENSVYIFDTVLKDCEYYSYENGKFELQDFSGYEDITAEWFSSFVGKNIYIEEYEGAKINIAGVVNTGAYSLSFRDVGLDGEDDLGNDLNEMRNNTLYNYQRYSIGCGMFCTEEFVRNFAVNGGSLLIGGRNVNSSMYEEDGQNVSFTLTCGTTAYNGNDENITVSNTVRFYNSLNRLYAVRYKDDEGEHSYYLREPTEEDGVVFTNPGREVVSDHDICDEDEIMLSASLYEALFDGKYNYVNYLPAHIGEKITVSITVNGETYEIKDKTFVGVYEDTYCYYDAAQFGIICPCDEVNRLIADYSTLNYSAVVDISGLSEGELASLFRDLEDYDAYAFTPTYQYSHSEVENIGNAKDIYMVISAVLFVMSLLFGAWNVLHTIKRDYREIGILRANGVTAKDMSIIYAVQFIICGVLSFIISLVGVNILTAIYVPIDNSTFNFMAFFPEFRLYWVGARQVLLLLAISLIVPLIISLFAFFRVRKISPVEAINEAKRNE